MYVNVFPRMTEHLTRLAFANSKWLCSTFSSVSNFDFLTFFLYVPRALIKIVVVVVVVVVVYLGKASSCNHS